MAQYDGSIRINTQINTQNASAQLMNLANRIEKTADKIASLRSKMDALKDVKIPTQEYKAIESDIVKAERELEKLIEKQAQMQRDGKDSGTAWELINQRIQATKDYIEQAKVEQQELVNSGKAFTLGTETEEYKKAEADAKNYGNTLEALTQKQQELNGTTKAMSDAEYMRQAEENIDRIIARLEEARQKEAETPAELLQPRIVEMDTGAFQEGQREAQALADAVASVGQNAQESANKSNEAIASMTQGLAQLKARQKELEKAGMGLGFEEYDANVRRIAEINEALKNYRSGLTATESSHKELGKSVRQFGKSAKSVFSSLNNLSKKLNSAFKKLVKTMSGFSKTNKKTAENNNNLLKSGFKFILKYGLGIRSLYVLVNKIRNGIKEGFTNFMEYSSEFKSSIDSIKASALTLKNAFAAAFSPLVEIAIPYIQRVIDYLVKLLDVIGQVMAAITGQETYTRAIKQTTAAIEDQNKAQNKQLSGLDKLNNLTSSSGGGGAGGGAADMFEEAPIEDKWKKTADKIKEIGKNLFAPLKAAWDKEGKFVMDSWKYALDEIKKLVKDIGKDFMTVWNQPETIAMFEDIFHIVGDIGLVVGNLARNFRAAWNENKVGLHIFENIRDILAVIIHNIRLAADYTVEWSDKLDFYPLLSKIEEWTKSLIPVFDALSGIVMDFYTMVLLPLAKWTLEKGLPELLQVFIDFNEKVDWVILRANLAEFWKHLEPFAETIGEGLIIFIGRLSDALANFVNSDMFAQFLTTVENWMDNVKPEDVANALEKLAIAIIAIKGAIMGFSAISAAIPVFKSLASVLGLFGPAGIAVGALALAAFLSKTIEDVDMGKVGQAVGNAVIKLVDFIGQALSQTNWYMLGQKVVDLIAGIDWIGLFTSLVEALASILGNVIGGAFALVQALSEGIANLIINAIDAAKEYFQGKIEEAGGNIVLGILKGIVDGFVGIGNWIVEHIFQPFITGFKNAFGIHSPSTVMMEMGAYIIQGLLDGITSLVDKITETWESMKETALEIWENVKTGLSEKWESMKESATTKWTEIKENLNATWDTMKTTAEMNFSAIRDYIVEKWADTESNTDSTWGRIKETVSSIASDVSAVISLKFSEILSSFGSFSANAQSAWANTWENIKNKLGSILSSIKDAVSSAFNWISDKIGSIGSAISGAFSGGGGATTYSGVMSYSAMPQMAALSKMEFPGYATGQVIPTSMKKHLAWLGDNKHETEVVSPLSTIEKAVENAMERAGGMGVRKVTIEIPLVVDGRELTRVVQDYDLQAYGRRGKGLFEH